MFTVPAFKRSDAVAVPIVPPAPKVTVAAMIRLRVPEYVMLLAEPALSRDMLLVPVTPNCGPMVSGPASASIVKFLTLGMATVLDTPPPMFNTLIVPLPALLLPAVLIEPMTPFVVADPMLKTWGLFDCRLIVPPFDPLAVKEALTNRVPPLAPVPAVKSIVPPLPFGPGALTTISAGLATRLPAAVKLTLPP